MTMFRTESLKTIEYDELNIIIRLFDHQVDEARSRSYRTVIRFVSYWWDEKRRTFDGCGILG